MGDAKGKGKVTGGVKQSLDEWLNDGTRTYTDIFESSNGVIIGLGVPVLKIFKCVTEDLAFLHKSGRVHGKLQSLKISLGSSSTPNITAYTQPQQQPLSTMGIQKQLIEGIITDIRNLRAMVQRVVHWALEKFQMNEAKIGPLWTLFNTGQVYLPTDDMNMLQAQKCSFFNCTSPIFLDKEAAYSLTHKLYEIRSRYSTLYDELMPLNTPETDMTDWVKRITDPELKVMLFDDSGLGQTQSRFDENPAVLIFMRIPSEHGRDKVQTKWAGKVWKAVRECLPDALPKMHFLFCTVFGQDAQKATFKGDVLKLLRHGPFGFEVYKELK